MSRGKHNLRDAAERIWSKGPQGRNVVKKNTIWKVLRMGLPIVENLSGLQESIFSLSRKPQLHFGQKLNKIVNLQRIHVKNLIKGTLSCVVVTCHVLLPVVSRAFEN